MISNDITGILLIAVACPLIWYDSCRIKAKSQRMDLLNRVANVAKNSAGLLADYNYVSEKQHVLALVFFRDPYKLYPNTIQQLL